MAKNIAKLDVTIISQPPDGDSWYLFHKVRGDDYTELILNASVDTPTTGEFLIGSTLAETATNYANSLVAAYPDKISIDTINNNIITFSLIDENQYLIGQPNNTTRTYQYFHTYRERIYYEFYTESGNYKRVSIQDNEYTGDPVEVIATDIPFEIEYPEVDVFYPIKGAGANIEFLYKGDESFIRELFSFDIRRFKVILYNVSVDGYYTIEWNGFLNTELYNEDYSINGSDIGTVFNFTANDGFGSLDRYKVGETDPNIFTIFDFLKKIVLYSGGDDGDCFYYSKIFGDAKFNFLNFASDLNLVSMYYVNTVSYYYPIYFFLYFNKTNFLDEDGEYMDLKEALKSILLPFRLMIIKDKNNYIINTINLKHEHSSLIYETFDIVKNIRAYALGTVLNHNYKYIKDHFYGGSNQRLTFIPAINKQIISSDTYPDNDIFINRLNSGDVFNGYDGVTNYIDVLNGEYSWDKYLFTENIEFDSYAWNYSGNTFYPEWIKAVPTGTKNIDNETYYCVKLGTLEEIYHLDSYEQSDYSEDLFLKSKILIPESLPSGKVSLSIKMDAMITFYLEELYSEQEDLVGEIYGFELQAYLKFGGLYLTSIYNNSGITQPEYYGRYRVLLQWSETPGTFPLFFSKNPDSETNSGNSIFCKWKNLINYNYDGFFNVGFNNTDNNITGELTTPYIDCDKIPTSIEASAIEFGVAHVVSGAYLDRYNDQNVVFTGTSSYIFSHKFIKDLSITINGDIDDNKTEFTWLNEKDWESEGDEVELKFGTSCMGVYGKYEGNPLFERGSMFAEYQTYGGSMLPLNSINAELDSNKSTFVHDNGTYGLIEDMVLNSIVANRGEKLVQLSLNLKDNFISVFDLIEMPDFPDKKLMFTGGVVNIRNGTIQGTWREIKPD